MATGIVVDVWKLLFHLIAHIRSDCEEYIAAGVEGSFHRVLYYSYDEADCNYLHCDVVAYAKEGACHRDQQQRAAGHSGCTACTKCGDDAEQQGAGERWYNT